MTTNEIIAAISARKSYTRKIKKVASGYGFSAGDIDAITAVIYEAKKGRVHIAGRIMDNLDTIVRDAIAEIVK